MLNFIGTLSGINVQFDRQYFRDVPVTVALEDVTVEEALQQVLSANGHFYKVAQPDARSSSRRTTRRRTSSTTTWWCRCSICRTPTRRKSSQIINTVMRIPTCRCMPAMFPNKTANTITVRATAAVVDVIEQLIRANDKPRAEVVIDVQILEVNRNAAEGSTAST